MPRRFHPTSRKVQAKRLALLRLSRCPGSRLRLSDGWFLPIMGSTTLILALDLTFLMLLPWFVGERGQDDVTSSLAWLGRPFIKLLSCIGPLNTVNRRTYKDRVVSLRNIVLSTSGYHTRDLNVWIISFKCGLRLACGTGAEDLLAIDKYRLGCSVLIVGFISTSASLAPTEHVARVIGQQVYYRSIGHPLGWPCIFYVSTQFVLSLAALPLLGHSSTG